MLKEPKIEEEGDFVDVELFREVVNNKKENNSDRFRPIKTECEEDILNYLKEHKKMTKKICLELLKIKETKIKELLNKMIKEKIIIRLGNGRTTYYELF